MNKVAIVGAGGLGREVVWILERINSKEKKWEILGFYDDYIKETNEALRYPILGNIENLCSINEEINIICAISDPEIRKSIIKKLVLNNYISFPTIIDPSVTISLDVVLGMGNIIMMNNLISVKAVIKDFSIITYSCTIGHDVYISDYVTVYPGVNIAGNVTIHESSEIGTGSQIIQGKKVGTNTIVGAGSVVIKDLPGNSTYVGIPAKPIK